MSAQEIETHSFCTTRIRFLGENVVEKVVEEISSSLLLVLTLSTCQSYLLGLRNQFHSVVEKVIKRKQSLISHLSQQIQGQGENLEKGNSCIVCHDMAAIHPRDINIFCFLRWGCAWSEDFFRKWVRIMKIW